MKKLKIWVLQRILPELLRRRSPDRIPRSGKAGEAINCFSVFLENDAGLNFYAESMQGTQLRGKRWDGTTFAINETIVLSGINTADLRVTHYYGLTDIRFRGLWALTKARVFGVIYAKIHLQRTWAGISQYIFNRRSLVTMERTQLLQFLIEHHIEHPGRPVSVIDVMTGLHSLRWVLHPGADSQQRKLELYLDSLCISGELSKRNGRYLVAGQAIASIEKYAEEERRHSENTRIQYGILIGTIAMAVCAWQSNKLSQRVAQANEEPVLELSVIDHGRNAPLAYELYNGSSFALENIEITDYLYAANLKLEFASAIPLGGQTIVPQHSLDRLEPWTRGPLSTVRTTPTDKQFAEMSSGSRVAILHLDISYRNALTHKQYERTDRYILLPSETGWTINRVLNGTAWATTNFKMTKYSGQRHR